MNILKKLIGVLVSFYKRIRLEINKNNNYTYKKLNNSPIKNITIINNFYIDK